MRGPLGRRDCAERPIDIRAAGADNHGEQAKIPTLLPPVGAARRSPGPPDRPERILRTLEFRLRAVSAG